MGLLFGGVMLLVLDQNAALTNRGDRQQNVSSNFCMMDIFSTGKNGRIKHFSKVFVNAGRSFMIVSDTLVYMYVQCL